ncbi:cyclic nucleotide-gated cation channel beta-3-like [Galendromus occidentalis]|uniref:Cyclic nucleotide-gated cation channel beta-3-like n=1 Tax=Galendromus occidentalis TaxID=34638 RepID=A0AAJ7WHV0_9ACAR|nr:cyclic nucleotide-gated cation channel beta-3-like [Galendromus occidentalis]
MNRVAPSDLPSAEILQKWKQLTRKTFDPQEPRYVAWQLLVAAAYAYNAWTPLLRVSFWVGDTSQLFQPCDILCDVVYFIDIIVLRPRERFYKSGTAVKSFGKTARKYLDGPLLRRDLLSLVPLDYIVTKFSVYAPLLRYNRLLRIESYLVVFEKMEMVSKNAFLWRLVRIVSYMLLVIHLNACAYYVISRIQGIGSNSFVLQGEGELVYIRCFYFSFKTAAGIGKNARPTHEWEYIFMATLWLEGSFIFAFILGQIKDIVATAVRGKAEYQESMDMVVRYMVQMDVTAELDLRVRRYLVETYATKKTLAEEAVLGILPGKERAEVLACETKDVGIKL